MTQTIEIQEGETGIDVGFNYPTAASILAKGYTFIAVYDSPNVKKNAPDPKVQEYIDAGLGVWHVYEVNAAHTLLGKQAGITDALAFNKTLARRNVPLQVPGIFANDTDTTTGNVSSQVAYMVGAHDKFGWPMGGYQDIDLTRATQSTYIPWSLLSLPNAWAWNHPNPKLKSEAIKQARQLGYHLIQGRLSDDIHEPSYDNIDGIAVDINHCIRPCTAWGNPKQQKVDSDMTPLFFQTDPNGGSYMWISGEDPVPFASVEDRDAILKFYGKTPGDIVMLTAEMFNRLFIPKAGPGAPAPRHGQGSFSFDVV